MKFGCLEKKSKKVILLLDRTIRSLYNAFVHYWGKVMARKSKIVISEQLRQAIIDSGQSLLGIAKGCGVDDGALSRFMRKERDLITRSVYKVCKYLNLELRKSKQKRR